MSSDAENQHVVEQSPGVFIAVSAVISVSLAIIVPEGRVSVSLGIVAFTVSLGLMWVATRE